MNFEQAWDATDHRPIDVQFHKSNDELADCQKFNVALILLTILSICCNLLTLLYYNRKYILEHYRMRFHRLHRDESEDSFRAALNTTELKG